MESQIEKRWFKTQTLICTGRSHILMIYDFTLHLARNRNLAINQSILVTDPFALAQARSESDDLRWPKNPISLCLAAARAIIEYPMAYPKKDCFVSFRFGSSSSVKALGRYHLPMLLRRQQQVTAFPVLLHPSASLHNLFLFMLHPFRTSSVFGFQPHRSTQRRDSWRGFGWNTKWINKRVTMLFCWVGDPITWLSFVR